MDEVGVEFRNLHVRQTTGDSAELGADRLYRQLEEIDGRRGEDESDDGSGNARRETAADDQGEQCEYCESGSFERDCVEATREGFHAQPEHAGNFVEVESEEVFYLRAGDEDGNSVGESNDHWAGDELYRGAEPGEAHDDQEYAGHDGAHEESIDAVSGDNARDYDDEGAGGATDLSLRAAQGGDEKSGDDRAVDSCLRREA